MKILTTGSTGFIATHLINTLVKKYPEAEIEAVDNLCNSELTEEKKKFFEEHNIKFIESSVEDFIPSEEKYDIIFHLASPVGPAAVLNYAGRMAKMIINDAIKMADLALRDNAKYIDISTSEVYGAHAEDEAKGQSEDTPKIVPAKITVRLEYGVGKMACEVALMNLAKITPLKVNFIRPFNIVGPYQKGEAGFVLPRFVEQALKNEPLTVFGDGTQKRTFTHVQDIVDAIIMIAEADKPNQIYNVGNPANLCSIKRLAEKVIEFSGSKSEINLVDPKTIYGNLYEEAWNKVPNIDRIKSEIGWEPKYALDDVIKEYIEFARK